MKILKIIIKIFEYIGILLAVVFFNVFGVAVAFPITAILLVIIDIMVISFFYEEFKKLINKIK